MEKEKLKRLMNQLVSVIVPIYNVEKYLARCVDSILIQTYSYMEIILVDDGSTDNCPQICELYKSMDKRVKVIHKQNGGLSDARNVGFDISEGEFICFIDSDDYIAPSYVEELVNIIDDYECDISVCSFQSVFDGVEKAIFENERAISCYSGIEMISHMYDERFLETVVAWNKMYKRYIIEGTKYPVGLVHEDEATTCELLFKASKVGVTTNKLYFYYIRQNSIMNSEMNLKTMDAKLTALKKRMDFLKRQGLLSFYSKDNLRFMKQISKNCYLSKDMDDSYQRQMKVCFRKEYKVADKQEWNLKNKILMAISFVTPDFYGRMKLSGLKSKLI